MIHLKLSSCSPPESWPKAIIRQSPAWPCSCPTYMKYICGIWSVRMTICNAQLMQKIFLSRTWQFACFVESQHQTRSWNYVVNYKKLTGLVQEYSNLSPKYTKNILQFFNIRPNFQVMAKRNFHGQPYFKTAKSQRFWGWVVFSFHDVKPSCSFAAVVGRHSENLEGVYCKRILADFEQFSNPCKLKMGVPSRNLPWLPFWLARFFRWSVWFESRIPKPRFRYELIQRGKISV